MSCRAEEDGYAARENAKAAAIEIQQQPRKPMRVGKALTSLPVAVVPVEDQVGW